MAEFNLASMEKQNEILSKLGIASSPYAGYTVRFFDATINWTTVPKETVGGISNLGRMLTVSGSGLMCRYSLDIVSGESTPGLKELVFVCDGNVIPSQYTMMDHSGKIAFQNELKIYRGGPYGSVTSVRQGFLIALRD